MRKYKYISLKPIVGGFGIGFAAAFLYFIWEVRASSELIQIALKKYSSYSLKFAFYSSMVLIGLDLAKIKRPKVYEGHRMLNHEGKKAQYSNIFSGFFGFAAGLSIGEGIFGSEGVRIIAMVGQGSLFFFFGLQYLYLLECLYTLYEESANNWWHNKTIYSRLMGIILLALVIIAVLHEPEITDIISKTQNHP